MSSHFGHAPRRVALFVDSETSKLSFRNSKSSRKEKGGLMTAFPECDVSRFRPE